MGHPVNLSIPLMNNSRERIREEVDGGVASNDYGRMPKLHPILKSGICRAFRKRLAGFASLNARFLKFKSFKVDKYRVFE